MKPRYESGGAFCIPPKFLIYSEDAIKETTMRIELRAAEGGMDAKLFMQDLANTYQKYLTAKG